MSPIALPRQLKKVSDRVLLKALESGLEIVETNLLTATQHADKIAGASARHLVAAGGKRRLGGAAPVVCDGRNRAGSGAVRHGRHGGAGGGPLFVAPGCQHAEIAARGIVHCSIDGNCLSVHNSPGTMG